MKKNSVEVKIYGALPKEKINYEMNGDIELIDKFEIYNKTGTNKILLFI